MAKVKVRMYATVREAAGIPETEVVAADLEVLLRRLAEMFGSGFSHLLAGGEGVVILVNGRTVKSGPGSGARLSEGDEVSIFPPVSGG